MKLHDPFRPDDEMHAVLEEYNEDLVLKGMEKESENPSPMHPAATVTFIRNTDRRPFGLL